MTPGRETSGGKRAYMQLVVGEIFEGKVTGITKFGAFVAMPDGRNGLVHISEIANTFVNDINDYVKEGQMVKVKVIGIGENGKVNLSMKQVLVVAWFCAIFVPWGEPATVGAAAVLGAVIFLVKCLIDFVVCGVIENSCSRSRFKVLGNQTWAVVGIAVLAFVFVVVGV